MASQAFARDHLSPMRVGVDAHVYCFGHHPWDGLAVWRNDCFWMCRAGPGLRPMMVWDVVCCELGIAGDMGAAATLRGNWPMTSNPCGPGNTTERRRSSFRRVSVGTSRQLRPRREGTASDRRPGRPLRDLQGSGNEYPHDQTATDPRRTACFHERHRGLHDGPARDR